jgi:hypothetical protein
MSNCLKIFISLFHVFLALNVLYSQELQLSTPEVNTSQAFLQGSPILLKYDFRMQGAIIRYTLDGKMPIISSKIYSKPIAIKSKCIVRAAVFHPDFQSSDEVVTNIYARPIKVAKVTISKPNDKYSGDGSASIHDGVFGSLDFKSKYLGFNEGSVEATITLNKKQKIKQVSISLLVQQGSWIFGPSRVTILSEAGKQLSEYIAQTPISNEKTQKKVIIIPLSNVYSDRLKIVISPLGSIPSWHDGAGSKGWLFIDEIWVE